MRMAERHRQKVAEVGGNMSILDIIAGGGRQGASPVERYMQTKDAMQKRSMGQLAMKETRQGMQMKGQEADMKAIAPVLRDILAMPAEAQENAYQDVLPSLSGMVQNKDGIPKTFNAEGAKSIVTNVFGDIDKFDEPYVDPNTKALVQKDAKTGKVTQVSAAQRKGASFGLSFGEKAVDRAFAPDYVEWSTGGFADVEKNLGQLKSVHERLGGDENLTGPVIGRTPDIVRAMTHPESLDVRDEVEEVVQRNLRLILGAQFTQREGERLIARAYNENLDESVNEKRVGRLIKAIQGAAEAKQEAVDFYNEHGTLSGFKGKKITIEDIGRAIEEGEEEKSPAEESPEWSIKAL